MFKHLAAYILTIVICALSHSASALSVKRLNERDGLPNRQAYAIKPDSAGYVWVFTESGLARYDGNEFRSYPLDGVSHSRNFAMFLTSLGLNNDGDLWLSLNSGQIFTYNRRLDRFDKTFDFNDNGTSCHIYDVLPDGDSMIVSTSDGIYRIIGDSLARVVLAGNTVHSVLKDDDRNWFAATADGLYHLTCDKSGNECKATVIDGSEGISVSKLAKSANKIIAGTFADGIYVIDTKKQLKAEKLKCEIPNLPVTSIVSDSDDSFFVSVDGAGIYEIDTRAGTVINRFAYDPSDEMLSANTVSDIGFDRAGGLWISTTSHGINYLSENRQLTSFVRHDKNNSNSLNADCVNIIFQDTDGDMWYGTDAGLSLRRNSGQWSHFLTRVNEIDNNILTITQSPDGTIYAGGYGSGAWTVDKKSGAVHRLPSRQSDRGIATEHIYEIFCDDDNIWFGGIQGDLTRYCVTDDSWHYYPSECICDIIAVGDDSVWITGCDGIGIWNRAEPDTVRWNSNIGGIDIFNYTRDIVHDRKRNEMWFATDGQGLIVQDLATGKATVFDLDDRNDTDNIFGIVMDRRGKIWATTEHDLFVIDADRRRVNRITPLLRLPDISFISRALMLDSDDNLVIGTTDGAITIDTDLEHDGPQATRLIFTDLTVNHKKCRPGADDGILEEAIDNLDKLTLSHRQNTFSLHFSSVSNGNNGRFAYEWRLKGYDNEWQPADASREITCRNIPFGKYRLEIRAVDLLDGDIAAERSLEVCIKPPLWLTWWAKLAYLAVAAILGLLLFKYIRRRQRERRLTDKIQSFLNIIHDLRTPVTLIKAPLGEIESRSDLPEETRRNANLAMSNVDRLLSMIGRLLDLRRENQHSDCLNLTKTDLSDYLESKIAEWRVAAIHKGLRIDMSVPDDMPAVMIDCNKISHVLDNLLSNAIKYTFSGSVSLNVSHDRKHWTLEIADTGIGIPRSDISRLFHNQYRGANAISTDEIGSGMGLLIVHRLCALHKVRIKVKSRENEGTTFSLRFPMNIRATRRDMPDIASGQNDISSPEAIDQEKETVLLVDDEKEILDYLEEVLSPSYNIVKCLDATTALERIGEVNPDIVISDVRLNGMTGFELCQKLKSAVETSHIPVILLSALGERQNIILGLESGANDYIVKPFDISVLRLRIRNILSNRRQLQEHVIADEEPTDEANMINELDKEFMEKLRGAIDRNLSDSEYSIADLCRDLGMSRTTIYNKIKALSGESINEYIRIRRLNKSKELLATRRYSISEVAYMVGFSDPKYFSTCFKKQFGISPSKA